MLNALDRLAYASGTSPATVLSLPLPQPARASAAAIPASNPGRVTRRGLVKVPIEGWIAVSSEPPDESELHGVSGSLQSRRSAVQQPRRKTQHAGGVDDHGVDVGQRFDELEAALGAEHEHRLGQGFARQAVGRRGWSRCARRSATRRCAGRSGDESEPRLLRSSARSRPRSRSTRPRAAIRRRRRRCGAGRGSRSSRAGRAGRRARGCRRPRRRWRGRCHAAAGWRCSCRRHGLWRSRRGRCARRSRAKRTVPLRRRGADAASRSLRGRAAQRLRSVGCPAVVVEMAHAGVGDVERTARELRKRDGASHQVEHSSLTGTGARAASRLMRDSSEFPCTGSSTGRCGACRPSPPRWRLHPARRRSTTRR